jgi:hypothetical protein
MDGNAARPPVGAHQIDGRTVLDQEDVGLRATLVED